MKSKLAAMAACLLLGGLASLAEAGVFPGRECGIANNVASCSIVNPICRCVDGQTVSGGVTKSWCRDSNNLGCD